MANKEVLVDKEVKIISIDAEFTSFDMMGGDLISFGAVEILEDYTLGRRASWNLRPRSAKYFTEASREVHGISYFKAETFPERKDSCMSILEWLKPLEAKLPLETAYFGTWNFDLRWLKYTMDECGLGGSFGKAFKQDKEDHFSVLNEAKRKLKHIQDPIGIFESESQKSKGKYKLDNVCRFYNIDLNHHEVLSDALANAEIYCRLMKNENTWTGELF